MNMKGWGEGGGGRKQEDQTKTKERQRNANKGNNGRDAADYKQTNKQTSPALTV